MRKLLLAAVSCMAITAAHAKSYIVAFPANMSDATRDAASTFMGGVYQGLNPGDVLIAFDASHLKKVGEIRMPDKIGDGRRGRIKALGAGAGQTAEFIGSNDPAFPKDVMDIPASLRVIGGTIMAELPNRDAHVLFLGSLVYDNPKNARGFTNREYIFSDGFLAEKGGTFGVAGEQSILKGAIVSICYTDKDFKAEAFRQSTVAFWGKSIVGRGGRVGSIEAVSPACPARLMSDAVDPTPYVIDMKSKTYIEKQHWVAVEVR